MTEREYRDQLYRYRSHPHPDAAPVEIDDKRGSFLLLYVTIGPFLVAEYLAESVEMVPSGLIFPVGFFLFWAFFYIYYKPDFLEKRMSQSKDGGLNLLTLPSLLIGLGIWVVKSTWILLSDLILLKWLRPMKQTSRVEEDPFRRGSRGNLDPAESRTQKTHPFQTISDLPPDIRLSLAVLGLQNCRSWDLIHQRYRELAKRLHPDLNPEITRTGHRFMELDAAYKKLATVRERFFYGKRQTG